MFRCLLPEFCKKLMKCFKIYLALDMSALLKYTHNSIFCMLRLLNFFAQFFLLFSGSFLSLFIPFFLLSVLLWHREKFHLLGHFNSFCSLIFKYQNNNFNKIYGFESIFCLYLLRVVFYILCKIFNNFLKIVSWYKNTLPLVFFCLF